MVEPAALGFGVVSLSPTLVWRLLKNKILKKIIIIKYIWFQGSQEWTKGKGKVLGTQTLKNVVKIVSSELMGSKVRKSGKWAKNGFQAVV